MNAPEHPPLPDPDALDDGLRAAFRGPAAARASILHGIERLTGAGAPRVTLKESPSADGSSPVLKVGPSVQGLVPQGRGNYQLQGEIARGGMGQILKAHDADLGRDVALKVLREELAKRPEVIQRFVEEAQIGGQLQHPGIVPVYELGLMADQRPYFAMKLVKGRTLAALLAERQGERGAERRRLLDVFESVCQTIAYAHSKGVIHRDLKPANILIGAFGEVQVVDWGLAKVLKAGGVHDEKRSLAARHSNVSVIATVRSAPGSAGSDSLSGSVLGTPAYMPPEQARGDVEKLDERSDVFSLGAILCEILTGAPPYVGDAESTLEQAANGRLDDALKRIAGCQADPELCELAKQCLVPAPSARPRSAEVVAGRIHAYLAAVEERARAAQIRAAEAKVRARATLLLAAAGLALVLLGGGGWTWMQQQRAARVHATETAVVAALQEATLARGKQEWPVAMAALARANARVESGDASADLRAQVAALSATIEREAEAARRTARLGQENQRLLAALEDVRQPEGTGVYATDWKALERTYHDLFAACGVDVGALEPAEAARQLGERGIGVELAAPIDEWAGVRRKAKDADGAAALTALADALDPEPMRHELRAALQASDLESLRRLAKEASAKSLPAPTLRFLAHALMLGKDFDAAVKLLETGRRRHPQDFALAMELARTLRWTTPPRYEDAVRHYEAALALRPGNVETYHELGQVFEQWLARPADALEIFAAAVERTPKDGHLWAHLAWDCSNLGRHEEALAHAQRAVELAPADVWASCKLGSALSALGRRKEAIANFERLLTVDPRNVEALITLGTARSEDGRVEEALALARRAVEIDPGNVVAHHNVGMSLNRLGRLEEALEWFRREVAIDPADPKSQDSLGIELRNRGRNEEAIACFRRAIELAPALASAHGNLGGPLSNMGRHEEGVASTRRAAELDPSALIWNMNLAITLEKLGRIEEALASYQRASELDPSDAEVQYRLGLALSKVGRTDESIAAYRRAIELDPKRKSAHANLGAQLSNQGHHEEGIASFRRAIELDPSIPAFHENLGIALTKLGRIEESFAAFRRACELAPTDHERLVVFAFLLATAEEEDLRDPAEAIAFVRRAPVLAGQRVPPAVIARYHDVLAIALYADGEPEQACETLARAVAIAGEGGPNDARQLFLALCHHDLGHEPEARACFEKAAPDFDALLEVNPQLRRFIDAARAAFADRPER